MTCLQLLQGDDRVMTATETSPPDDRMIETRTELARLFSMTDGLLDSIPDKDRFLESARQAGGQ